MGTPMPVNNYGTSMGDPSLTQFAQPQATMAPMTQTPQHQSMGFGGVNAFSSGMHQIGSSLGSQLSGSSQPHDNVTANDFLGSYEQARHVKSGYDSSDYKFNVDPSNRTNNGD